jgi:hypothetical protein
MAEEFYFIDACLRSIFHQRRLNYLHRLDLCWICNFYPPQIDRGVRLNPTGDYDRMPKICRMGIKNTLTPKIPDFKTVVTKGLRIVKAGFYIYPVATYTEIRSKV